MSTPFPSQLPAELQRYIDQYASAKVVELAQEAKLANAPAKVLSPHESLVDHVARAEAALAGDSSAVSAYKVQFHILESLKLLIQELESASQSAASTASVASTSSVSSTPVDTSSVVTEGAI